MQEKLYKMHEWQNSYEQKEKRPHKMSQTYNKIPQYMSYSKLQSNESITNIIFKETEVPDILIIAKLLDDHTI